MDSYLVWHLDTSSQRLILSKFESPASHLWVTRLFQCGAIESPASRRKMRVLREAVLSRGDWPLLYDKLAMSNTYSHAKNRNDLRPITLSKVSLHEVGFSAVAILGGGWLQSPTSDGPPWYWCMFLNISIYTQAEPWWRASIWRSHRKVVIKQCSYHNNIIDIQNRLPYSKVVYPAIIVLFSCPMEVNHGVRTGPDYPFR